MWRRLPKSSKRPAPANPIGSSSTTRKRRSTQSPATSACCLSRHRQRTSQRRMGARILVNSLNASSLASLPEALRNELIDSLPRDKALQLKHDWPFRARDSQKAPQGDWRVWLLLAGRGFGKTRTGAELVRARVGAHTARRIALVAPTAADARDVMVEGESGLLAIAPPWDRPLYEPSKRRLTWPNGAVATIFSADEPERLRGPQHDFAWCDELAAWRYPEAWDMLMFGLRRHDRRKPRQSGARLSRPDRATLSGNPARAAGARRRDPRRHARRLVAARD